MPSYWTVATDPYFRMSTWMVIGLIIGNSVTGINAINAYTTTIF